MIHIVEAALLWNITVTNILTMADQGLLKIHQKGPHRWRYVDEIELEKALNIKKDKRRLYAKNLLIYEEDQKERKEYTKGGGRINSKGNKTYNPLKEVKLGIKRDMERIKKDTDGNRRKED